MLMIALTELFDVENDLLTKKEKYKARKEISNLVGTQNFVKRGNQKQYQKNNVSFPEHNLRNSPAKKIEQVQPAQNDPPKKFTNIQESHSSVPIYCAQQDIHSPLKRNTQNHEKSGKQQTRLMLLEQPMYTKMKQELERYKMREEQLQAYIEKRIQEGINHFIQNLEILKENKTYKTIKFYKQNDSFISDTPNDNSYSTQKTMEPPALKNQPFSQPAKSIQPMFSVSLDQVESHQELSEVTALELGLNKNEYNVDQVVSRISEKLQYSQLKLRQLRNQRKKMLLDDDVWAQFQKI